MKQQSNILKNSGLTWLWLALIIIIVDQATKIAVLHSFHLNESTKITEFFNLTYVRNYGAAFSFLADSGGWQRWFFTIIAVVAVGLLIFWLAKTAKQQIWLVIGFNFILGGASGNLYDRIAYGYVVDFLDFTIPLYGRWPAFNVADMAIVIGAGCILIDAFVNQKKSMTEQNKI